MKIFFRSIFLCFSFLLLFATGIAQAAIEIALETGPDPVLPNETANIAITISNSGNSLSGNLTVKMVYPEYINWVYDGIGIDGGECAGNSCDTNEIVTWNLGVLPPGLSRPMTMYPIVLNSAISGSAIPFNVEVFENNVKVADISRSIFVQTTVPYDIAVDEDINPVAPGQQLVYTITYSNRSSASATNTKLDFPLPQGVSFVTATSGGVLNGNTVEWNLNTLQARSGGTQKVTVTVDNTVAHGTIIEVDKAEISGLVNFISYASSALAATHVSHNSSLILAMELNPDPVKPNEVLNTALTVSNPTNSTLFGVTIALHYPEHLNWVYDGTGIDGGVCSGNSCDKNEIVTWQLGTFIPGSSQTVTLPPVILNAAPIGSLITFNAHVREDNGTRASQSRTVVVHSAPPFDIAVDEDINPVTPGAPLVYTITYSNRSSASATNTKLKFPLPQDVTFTSATNGGVLNGGIVEWNLNTLQAQTGGEQKVTVTVGSDVQSGSILEVDKAKISGLVNFISHTSNALATTHVNNSSSLVLAMELNPDPVKPNEVLNTVLTVSNSSNSALFGVVIELRYPEHINWVYDGIGIDGGICIGNSCDKSEIVTWQLGTLIPGSSQTVTLPPVVLNAAPIGSLITFNAHAKEDNGTRATQSRTVIIQNTPPFDIAVDEDVNPVAPGEPLLYTITYSNRSAASALNTSLSFPLPQGVTFVSATGGGVLNGNTVEWDLNTLPAHTGGEQKVTVDVNSTVTVGSLLVVDKTQISGQVNFLTQTSKALTATHVSNNASMILMMDLVSEPPIVQQGAVQPGKILNTTLTVNNPTSVRLFGVTLELRYPEHINWVYEGAGIDGGLCTGNSCDKSEIVTWQLGEMAPGSSRIVSLPPVVLNATTIGTLINFNAAVYEDNNTQVSMSKTIFVGTDFRIDSDGDGVLDKDDNCTLASNLDQRDSDGDGFGNICDADLDNSGFVNSIDFALFRQRLFTTDPDADLDGSGFVNSLDFGLFRKLLFTQPGPVGAL